MPSAAQHPTPHAGDVERLIRRLGALVAFDTQNPTGDERPMVDALARELDALGAAAVDVFAEGRHASVYARFGAETPRLLVNGHVDTVPANRGYSRPPLRLVEEGGRCYGLGACDTKGSIAAALDAVAVANDAGRPPRGLALLFSGDEERSGSCVRAFLRQGRGAGLVRAVACEPTQCRVGIRHRGIHAGRVIARSPGGHSSRADHLPSPVAVLARVATAFDAYAASQRDVGPPGFPGLCFNLAAIEGGLAFNVIPAQAELVFSLRAGPGVDVRGVLATLEAEARRAAAPEAVDIVLEHENPTFATRNVQAFAPLLAAKGGGPTDLGFWTEAALFAQAGIDAVVFGPGSIEQAHAADEFVEVSELVCARDAFVRLYDDAAA